MRSIKLSLTTVNGGKHRISTFFAIVCAWSLSIGVFIEEVEDVPTAEECQTGHEQRFDAQCDEKVLELVAGGHHFIFFVFGIVFIDLFAVCLDYHETNDHLLELVGHEREETDPEYELVGCISVAADAHEHHAILSYQSENEPAEEVLHLVRVCPPRHALRRYDLDSFLVFAQNGVEQVVVHFEHKHYGERGEDPIGGGDVVSQDFHACDLHDWQEHLRVHARYQHYYLEVDLLGGAHVLDAVRRLVADARHQYLEHLHVLEVVRHV